MWKTAVRAGWGLVLGTVTAAGTLACLVAAGVLLAPTLAWPQLRAAALRLVRLGALRAAGLERRRLARLLGDADAASYRAYDAERALAYLGVRWPIGLLGGAILLLGGYGAGAVVAVVGMWLLGRYPDGIAPTPLIVAYFTVVAIILGFLALQGLVGVVRLERRIAHRFLGPDPADALRRRIEELATSRAEVVTAVDAERRRIERDLHDGVQQRLVALGMLLGRARRADDPARAGELVVQAHEQSRQILDELREVAWRVYPTALDNLGLHDALARVAERAGPPVTLDFGFPGRPPPSVEAAAYFVVSEAVTNAVKHSGASRIDIHIGQKDDAMTLTVTDDGRGGADPGGAGLTGLARRVAALDGHLAVHSPAGGPTIVRAELPCG